MIPQIRSGSQMVKITPILKYRLEINQKVGFSVVNSFIPDFPIFFFKIGVVLTIWLPELTKTILSVGSLVVSTLEPFLFTMLQNFGKYAPHLPTPLYFVPNNLHIYLGWRLDPPPMLGLIPKFYPFF